MKSMRNDCGPTFVKEVEHPQSDLPDARSQLPDAVTEVFRRRKSKFIAPVPYPLKPVITGVLFINGQIVNPILNWGPIPLLIEYDSHRRQGFVLPRPVISET